MKIRILKIEGRRAAQRERHLERTRQWMEQRGWRLVDFSPEAGSAMFERAEDAPRLGWFDASRWLPGPDWFRPRAWLSGLRLAPRRVALFAVVGAVVATAFVTLLEFSHNPAASRQLLQGSAEEETWLYVSADALNVRGEPKPGAQIVGVLYRNQRVLVEERTDGWARIVSPQWGYVAASYLSDHPLQ